MTGRAGGQILPRASTAWALDVELHTSPGLGDLASAVALRTFPRSFEYALSVTLGAYILARDVQAHHAAPDCRPERHVHLVFQIAARLRTLLSAAAPATKHRAEDVAEAAAAGGALTAARAAHQIGEIESPEVEMGAAALSSLRCSREASESAGAGRTATGICFCCCGIDVVGVEANLVVDLALLGIAQDVVGFGDGLEFFLSRFVPGIYVGMVFTRKFAEGLADVIGRGVFLDAENLVVVFFGCGRHRFLPLATSTQASTPAPRRLIHKLPSLFVFDQHGQILERSRIHINRDSPRAGWSLDKHDPLSGVFGQIQKVRFFIHLEIQFRLLKSSHGFDRFSRILD